MKNETLREMVFATFDDIANPAPKFIYQNFKDEHWLLIAIYILAYNVSIFSMKGNPTTAGGPIQKEPFGTYIFCDELYFKGMNKMTSSLGVGYHEGSYMIYVFNYLEDESTEAQNLKMTKAKSEVRAAGFDVRARTDPESPGDIVLAVNFGDDFFELLRFDELFVEGKLV